MAATTSAPAPAPGASSNVPPWLLNLRAAQDKGITDFRGGMDQLYGGMGQLHDGMRQGFQDWRGQRDQRHTDLRNKLTARFDKLGERFQMPPGFASRLPWNQGKSGASGLGGTVPPGAGPTQGIAAGEPNPATPPAPGKAHGWGMWNPKAAESINKQAAANSPPGKAQGWGMWNPQAAQSINKQAGANNAPGNNKQDMVNRGRAFMPSANPTAQTTGGNPVLDSKKSWRW